MSEVYEVAGMSKQAHHQYFAREGVFAAEVEELAVLVDEIRREHPGCGLEKMYFTLQPKCMGRDKFIEVFMDLGYGVRRVRNHRRTTIPGKLRFPDLIKGMLVDGPNQVWQTDITYFDVRGRFHYIVFIIDIYTKLIVGHQVSDHLRADANMAALRQALRKHKPEPGLVHHSDHGTQYTSKDYLKLLRDSGFHVSMAECAQDNAYAERINGTIKNEYLAYWTIEDLKALKASVARAVKQYNEKRIHNSLPGKTTPMNFLREWVHLSDQERPKVIVYADGNYKLREASSLPEFRPEKGTRAPVCPIILN